MEIGIIGLPQSGKTTIFNAATRGLAQVASYASAPNIGVAKVPDQRLDILTEIFDPKKTISAEITYVDIPASPEGLGKNQGISGEYLNMLQRSDALLLVVRAFDNPAVPHILDSIDPSRDIENLMYELTFVDLEILDRRISRISDGLKSAGGTDREILNREMQFLHTLKSELEQGTHIRDRAMSEAESRLLSGFQLLTGKPLIVVVNVDEEQLGEVSQIESELDNEVAGDKVRVAVLCGELEMDLAQMDETEDMEFRESLGIVLESGLKKMIRLSYSVLDLISFLTVGEDEVRAWPITRGTVAQKAAGKIHTDLERGFIRGEVVSYKDLRECGSLSDARKKGLLRQEGKEYVVRDGDIMHVLFNI